MRRFSPKPEFKADLQRGRKEKALAFSGFQKPLRVLRAPRETDRPLELRLWGLPGERGFLGRRHLGPGRFERENPAVIEEKLQPA